MNRVVVTGMGAITPVGLNVDTFWGNIKNGQSGISTIDTFDVTDFKVKIAGLVRGFDAAERWGRKEARKMDLYCQYALAAAEEAVENSELDLDTIDKERFGVYVGSGIGGINVLIDGQEQLQKRGSGRVSPSLVPMMIANVATAKISIRFGAQGPSMAPVTACSTGNTSIGEAFNAIRYGDADIMIAGGAEAAITPLSLASFSNATALSMRNEDPAKASRPFDGGRDGFVMAEGAGILVIESLEHALRREAHIYGEVIGYGSSSDAYHVVASHPEGDGAYIAMKNALKKAAIAPMDVDVINAHGTGTLVGDVSETKAIKRLFQDDAYKVPITANKSMTGHMFGAAGGAEAVALLKTLEEGIIPPTINQEQQDSDCDLDYVPNKARKQDATIGISNSFGFGGHNACLVLKRYTD